MNTLIDILRQTLNGDTEKGWLFLEDVIDDEWKAKSKGLIIDIDKLPEEELDNDFPILAKRNNLTETLDAQTIEDITNAAIDIEVPISDETLVEAFNYYYKYDTFLPEKGFIPLSQEDWRRNADLDFYSNLGDESRESKCARERCNRGSVKFSLFCRIHHFEMMKKKTCPFTH